MGETAANTEGTMYIRVTPNASFRASGDGPGTMDRNMEDMGSRSFQGRSDNPTRRADRPSLGDSASYQERSFYRELLLASQQMSTDPFLQSVLLEDDNSGKTNVENKGSERQRTHRNETAGVSAHSFAEYIPSTAPPPSPRTVTTAGLHDSSVSMSSYNAVAPRAEHGALSATTTFVDGLPTLDEEILTQYRIEAIYQAAAKCESNTKYNPLKAEQDKSKMARSDNDSSRRLFEPTIPKPKPRNPADVLEKFLNQPQFQFKEPSMPRSTDISKPKLPINRKPEGSAFCRGVLIDDAGNSQQDNGKGAQDQQLEMRLAQCMGCHSKLNVPFAASLMVCPKCSAVSPALTYREG